MIAWFSTKGTGTNDARRMATLLSTLPDTLELPFAKGSKLASFRHLLAEIRRLRPRLLVMEGTGLAGGVACLIGRLVFRIPYVVSSGDAVGPFVAAHHPLLGWCATIYEIFLCRFSAGFVGWTPYLTGRALTFGAPRGMTAAGWALGGTPAATHDLRQELGISREHVVFGLVGSLDWNPVRNYCYGLELVRAIRRVNRPDIAVVIVGDGSGLEKLREEADPRVHLPGKVPLDEVMSTLAAFDAVSLPQSRDGVGLFRYTTKLSEYAAAGVPVVTLRLPLAYDLDDGGWMWRLPGHAPWDEQFIAALAELMEAVSPSDLDEKRKAIPVSLPVFDQSQQTARTHEFIADILDDLGR